MYSRALSLALLVALVTPALAQFPRRTPSREPATLRVRVVLGNETAAPRNLTVEVLTTSGPAVAQGFTDSTGQAEFNVFPGNYHVRVRGPNIESTTSPMFTVNPYSRFHLEVVPVQLRRPAGVESGAAASGDTVPVSEMNVPEAAQKEFERANREAARQRWKDAAKLYRRAIQRHPEYPSAYNNLGVALANMGRTEEARQAFQQSIDLNPHNAEALFNLGRLEYHRREFVRAKPLLAACIALDRGNPEALLLLATAQLLTGEVPAAIANARRVHQLEHEGFGLAHMVAARGLQSKGRLDEAAREYELFLKEEPDAPIAAQARTALEAIRKQQARP